MTCLELAALSASQEGKGEGHGSGPSGYHCCFGHREAGEGWVALPLTSSVHAGGQSHSPLPFDPGQERLIWEFRQNEAHLAKLLVSVDWGEMEGIAFFNLF